MWTLCGFKSRSILCCSWILTLSLFMTWKTMNSNFEIMTFMMNKYCYCWSLICYLICFTEDITTQREMLFTSLPLSVIVSKVLPIAENPPTLYTTNDHDSIQKRVSATKIGSIKLSVFHIEFNYNSSKVNRFQ